MVVCGRSDYKLYKNVFESRLGNFLILETTEGNRKVRSSICKLCTDVKLTYIAGTNIYKYSFVKRSKYLNRQN